MADSTLNRFVAQFADAAARVAFVPTPPTPASGPDPGYFALQQDDGSIWAWDTALVDWVSVGGGAGSDVSFNTVAIGIASPPAVSALLQVNEATAPAALTNTALVLVTQDDAAGFGATAGIALINTNYSTDVYDGLTFYQEAAGNIGIGFKSETAGIYFTEATNELLFYAPLSRFAQQNAENAVTLTTPDTTDVAYDTTPIAAIYIEGPTSPSTRNFVSGIWVVTEGDATDKGRGIGVQNLGASDGIYVQNELAGGTGVAALNVAAGVGFVAENQDASAVGFVMRHGTGGGASTLGKFEANIAGSAELVTIASDQTSKFGVVYRMSGAGNEALTVFDAGAAKALVLGADDGHVFTTAFIDVVEMTAPAAPAANTGRLYVDDNGAGKSRLNVRFASGAVQVLATEP